jgi:hypothetical protein
MGYTDAKILFEHYLDRSGTDMWFGRRLVDLTEKYAAPLIEASKKIYLWNAARLMGGAAGTLPSGHSERFFSNAPGLPASHTPNQQISDEQYVAMGGFWGHVFYGGTVERTSQAWYRIELASTFQADKEWNFEPNTEMGISENPPAPMDLAPEWLPPILPGLPPWGRHHWRVYLPDEWGLALEHEGRAKSFTVKGIWKRVEWLLAMDRDCDGWDIGDILGEPRIIREYLPTNVDPTPYDSGEWVEHSG